ncbi:hypothetical protein HUJ05_012704 [Dendroctonus ponderosae]|nr:hypothetical protein HUJ05_012704 [Dendroctonus ponderosae]
MVETGKKTTSGLRLVLSVKKHSASLRLFRPGNKKCKHGPIFRWITGSSRGVKNMPVSRNKISYVIVQFDQRGVVDNVLLKYSIYSVRELFHSLHELHSFSENIYIISYMEMSEKDGFAYKYTSLSECGFPDSRMQ